MQLLGVGCTLPSQRISNQEIVDLVGHYSRSVFDGTLPALKARVADALSMVGIQSRYWRGESDRPLDLIVEASEFAARQANISLSQIDLLLYVGIDRGFLEPANACFVAKKLGITSTRCFDVVDACMGWWTAVQLVQSTFAAEESSTALIVSSEFPMNSNGAVLPSCFTVANKAELRWKLAGLTLGEAASATVLHRSGRPWKYTLATDSCFADLCTVSLPKFHEYADPTVYLGQEEALRFRAFGPELFEQAMIGAVKVLNDLLDVIETPKLVFPHSVSDALANRASKRLRRDVRLYSTFRELGNLATSSIPSCLVRALSRRDLLNGDVGVGWIGSSGMKFAAFEILNLCSNETSQASDQSRQ